MGPAIDGEGQERGRLARPRPQRAAVDQRPCRRRSAPGPRGEGRGRRAFASKIMRRPRCPSRTPACHQADAGAAARSGAWLSRSRKAGPRRRWRRSGVGLGAWAPRAGRPGRTCRSRRRGTPRSEAPGRRGEGSCGRRRSGTRPPRAPCARWPGRGPLRGRTSFESEGIVVDRHVVPDEHRRVVTDSGAARAPASRGCVRGSGGSPGRGLRHRRGTRSRAPAG